MKYSLEEFHAEYEKVRMYTCDGNAIHELMYPYRVKLHEGLEVGDGVTINAWSDCYACTVVRRTAKTLVAQRDIAIRTDKNGMSDCQSYRYQRDEHGTLYTCHWSNKHGCFMWGGAKDGKGNAARGAVMRRIDVQRNRSEMISTGDA